MGTGVSDTTTSGVVGSPRPNVMPEGIVPEQPKRSIWEVIPSPISVLGLCAVIVGLWQLSLSAGWISEFVLPSPSAVADQLWAILKDLVHGGYVWDNLVVTAKEVLIGFLIAIALGVGLGVAVAKTAFGHRVLRPFLVALYAAPKVAFAPILVAWFGFGMTPKFILAAVIAFFPLMVDTVAGLASVEQQQTRLFTMLDAGRVQRLWKLELPAALPFIFAGLKSAAVLTVIGVIVGEFLGGGEGLGALIRNASSQLALDRVFALVIVLSIFAYAFYAVIDLLERRLVFWRETSFVPVER